MIDEKLLKEAVETIKIRSDINPKDTQISVLLDLAEKFLAVSEFPEKKESSGAYTMGQPESFNEAIDLCKLAVMKEYVKKDEVFATAQQIEDSGYAKFPIKEELIKELEIAKGKILLSAYHSGFPVDVSWIEHRINELTGVDK